MTDEDARARLERADAFQRNPKLEGLLQLLSGPLAAGEQELIGQMSLPARPVLLIVGCARSGSTLLLQLLAASGAFGYPSNLLSRFYAAPALGAGIQKLMFDPDYRFRDELDLAPAGALDYASDLGKTRGALSPNEFFYFWRRWVAEVDGFPLTMSDDVGAIDFASMAAELRAVAAMFERPFVAKAHILNWILPAVLESVPDVYVLFLRRELRFVAQSLLESRDRFFGNERDWYSFKPPEYEALAAEEPAVQVAGQAYFTDRAVELGLQNAEPSRVLEIRYGDLVSDPAGVWHRIAALIGSHPGCPDLGDAPRREPFPSSDVGRLPKETMAAIDRAVAGLMD